MSLQLGDPAPDFEAQTSDGRIRFHDWMGSGWAILFSHPRDFTPVCTTELGYAARLAPQFAVRGVKLIGLSVDTLGSHRQWAIDIRETQGHALTFPVIADLDRNVARLYGMIHPQHDELFTVRTVFVIDPSRRIRLTFAYPQSCGRNFNEILRVVDALQRTDHYPVSTPVNWRPGRDVIIAPAITDRDAAERFPRGWRTLRPYLRLTPDPHRRPSILGRALNALRRPASSSAQR